MKDIKDYLEQTNTVLVTKDAFEYLKERASVPDKVKAEYYPSADLISREKTLTAFADYVGSGMSMDDYDALWDIVAKIPPVTPQPKTGYWIDDNENEIDAQYGIHLYKCSECDEYASAFVGGTEDWWDIEKPNYCPNCGSRMVEPQERSDKE